MSNSINVRTGQTDLVAIRNFIAQNTSSDTKIVGKEDKDGSITLTATKPSFVERFFDQVKHAFGIKSDDDSYSNLAIRTALDRAFETSFKGFSNENNEAFRLKPFTNDRSEVRQADDRAFLSEIDDKLNRTINETRYFDPNQVTRDNAQIMSNNQWALDSHFGYNSAMKPQGDYKGAGHLRPVQDFVDQLTTAMKKSAL